MRTLSLLLFTAVGAFGQQPEIVRLAPSSFPNLPHQIVSELQRRGCSIPQVINQPKSNVLKGHFASQHQTDWAVLCSIQGVSSIVVFWGGSPSKASSLNAAADLNYVQDVGYGRMGFSRGITAVSGKSLRRPHEGIEDSFVEKASTIYYYSRGKWLIVGGTD